MKITITFCILYCLFNSLEIFGDLDTSYFRIAEEGVVAVVGWPSNSPPILSSMLNSGLWNLHTLEPKKVDKVNVVLYNIEQLGFESNALPESNAPYFDSSSYVVFDHSKAIARPDITIAGINTIIESVKSTTKIYLNYILISQAADFRDSRVREFNSLIPYYTTATIPPFEPAKVPKKFLCLLGSPKPHKLYFASILHKLGILKQTAWTGGSFVGDTLKEFRSINEKRSQEDGNIDVKSIDVFVNKLPSIFDVDPSLEKQHSLINPELFSRGQIHIIIESEESSPDVDFCDIQFRYTEKVLKSIFLGYPFILFGNYATLNLLQIHGFQTFAPYINETYDLIPVRRKRLDAIVTEIVRINRLSDVEYTTLLEKCKKIAKINQEILQSKRFKERIREQGEYALGLSSDKVYDYSDIEIVIEKALQQVKAPACDNLPDPSECNPVCSYKILENTPDSGKNEPAGNPPAETVVTTSTSDNNNNNNNNNIKSSSDEENDDSRRNGDKLNHKLSFGEEVHERKKSQSVTESVSTII